MHHRRSAGCVLFSILLICLFAILLFYSYTSTFPPNLLKRLSGHSFWVNDISWSPDGKFLASASYDRTVRIWDVNSGQPVQTLRFEGVADKVAWSPDGKLLAMIVSQVGGDLMVWDTTTWTKVLTIDPEL